MVNQKETSRKGYESYFSSAFPLKKTLIGFGYIPMS